MQQPTPVKNQDAIDAFSNLPKYHTKFALLKAYITDDLKNKIREMNEYILANTNVLYEKIIARMHEIKQKNLPAIESKPDDFPIDPSYQLPTLDKDYLIGQLYYYLHWIGGRGILTDKDEEQFSAVLDRAVELIDPANYPRQQNNEPAKEVNIPVDQIFMGMSCAGSNERMRNLIFMYVTAMARTYHNPKISIDFGDCTPTIFHIFVLIPKDICELTIKCTISNTEQLGHFVLCLREYLSRENPLVALEMNAGKTSIVSLDAELFTPSDEDYSFIAYLEAGLKNKNPKITHTGDLLNNKQNRDVTAFLKSLAIKSSGETEAQYADARQNRRAEEQNDTDIFEIEDIPQHKSTSAISPNMT